MISRRLADQQPIIIKDGRQVIFKTAVVIGGNTLSTGQEGIIYVSTPITSVPSAYDPDIDTSFIDGIGTGQLYLNGVAQGNVLLVNDTRGGAVDFDLLGDADEPDTVRVDDPVLIEINSSGTFVVAYPITFI